MHLLSWLFPSSSLGRGTQHLPLRHLRCFIRRWLFGTCSPCRVARLCLWQRRRRLCSTALGRLGTCSTLLLRIGESLWVRRWGMDKRFLGLALAVLSLWF